MANQFLFVNFFATELISAVQVSDTVLQIPPDAALSMPPFTTGFDVPLTLWDGQNPPEIVWCTANPQTGALTVLRAQEGTSAFGWAAGTQVISSLTAAVINAALLAYNTGLVLVANYLPLSGGTLTGTLTLSGAPTLPLHAADKAYVDGITTGFMPISGGVFTGDVSMNGHKLLALPAPITGGEPATKAYADAITASASSYAQDVSGIYVTTGTGAAYALSPGKYGGGLTDGLRLGFRLHATSRNAPTLAVDGTAAVPLRTQSGVNETSATWPVGMVLSAEYRASGPEWLVFGNSMPLGTVATTGGGLAYFVNTGLGLTLLEDGIILQVQINAANTGTMTLNVDSLGAVPLRPYTGVDFKSGQVKQYAALLVRYNNATGEWLVIDQAAPRLDQCVDVTLTGLTAGQSLGYNGTAWVNRGGVPVPTTLLSGTAATYTTPVDANGNLPAYLMLDMIGAGGGGGARTTNAGGTGGTTSFGSTTAIGGTGGPINTGSTIGGAGGTGGTTGTGTQITRTNGADGSGSMVQTPGTGDTQGVYLGGFGGSSPFGGAGASSTPAGAAKANTGSGGGGAPSSSNAGQKGGGGGGAGERVRFMIAAPAASYIFTIGLGGNGGAAGGVAGANGADGRIDVIAYW